MGGIPTMKKIFSEAREFLENKVYMLALIITAVCGYGFEITHYSIGIDDTALDLYLEDGLVVEMGRWVMYLLNKIFHFSEFAPFMTELIGVLFMMTAAVLLSVFIKRMIGEKAGMTVYIIFSCLFISNPIISFDFIYYFHNGVGLGYVATALALLYFQELVSCRGRERIKPFVISILFIWVAAGCYESFIPLYILGILIILFMHGMNEKEELKSGFVLFNLFMGAAAIGICMILRTLIRIAVIALFNIDAPDTVLSLRSVSEMFVLFNGSEGLQELLMLIKRFWVVYHVNAIVYLPITGYEAACWIFGICSIIIAVKKRNLWYPVLFAGMLVTPFLLTFVEAKVTFYRSCQFMPFFTAVGAVLLYTAFGSWKYAKIWRGVITVAAAVLIFNQASQLNRNFYTDYREYELTKETLLGVAYDVEKAYGNSTPVVFVGQCDIPYEFIQDFYVPYDSWQYKLISKITDLVDEHLKEKYWQPQGYCFIGEANLPMIRWAFDAFDGTNGQMIRFLAMHGHTFTTLTDADRVEEITLESEQQALPRWPEEGSITMQDGYVLVNF
jgi:hypothetical protein